MKIRMITFLFATISVGWMGCTFEPEGGRGGMQLDVLDRATVYVEASASFPGEPLLWASGVEEPTPVTVALSGGLAFDDGDRKSDVMVVGDGMVSLPPLVGGRPGEVSAVVARGSDGASAAATVITLDHGAVDEILGALAGDDGVVARGPGFLVLDEARLRASDEGTRAGEGTSPLLGICFCPFLGNIGRLTIDASCRNRLATWVIPEFSGAALTPATAGTNYYADGFKIGNQIYKIDGSTCNTISCGVTTWSVNSCVNNVAALIGKSAPYPVNAGTFGNEPAPGVPAQYVQ